MNAEQNKRIVEVEGIVQFKRIKGADPDADRILDKALDAYQDAPVWCRQVRFWRIAAGLLAVAYLLTYAVR